MCRFILSYRTSSSFLRYMTDVSSGLRLDCPVWFFSSMGYGLQAWWISSAVRVLYVVRLGFWFVPLFLPSS